MNKLAIFVEGLTEQEFTAKLVEEIGGKHRVRVERRKASGGRIGAKRVYELVSVPPDAGEEYFVLVVDCGTDNRVSSDIRDNYDKLVKNGYQAIVAVRDVYPFAHTDIPALRRAFTYKLPTKPIQVVLALAIMEVEAWFVGEYTHFPRIDARLTAPRIQAEIGFDPSAPAPVVENRPKPSNDLHGIYQLVGLAYRKTKSQIQRTVEVLDYGLVYLDLHHRTPSITPLVTAIDAFFAVA